MNLDDVFFNIQTDTNYLLICLIWNDRHSSVRLRVLFVFEFIFSARATVSKERLTYNEYSDGRIDCRHSHRSYYVLASSSKPCSFYYNPLIKRKERLKAIYSFTLELKTI